MQTASPTPIGAEGRKAARAEALAGLAREAWQDAMSDTAEAERAMLDACREAERASGMAEAATTYAEGLEALAGPGNPWPEDAEKAWQEAGAKDALALALWQTVEALEGLAGIAEAREAEAFASHMEAKGLARQARREAEKAERHS